MGYITIPAIKEKDKKERVKKKNEIVMKSEYLTPHPMLGYDKRYVHFVWAGARGRGKSVLALDAPIDFCEKYGYENNKIFFFRLSDMSIKALLQNKAQNLIELIKENPFQNPPPYEKLLGNLSGLYSRRINIQHRLVYEVLEDIKTVKIISMWSHYENI